MTASPIAASRALDSVGNLHIAYTLNQRMRKVGAGGIISGRRNPRLQRDGLAATAARLENPNSVAVDSSGNLYIADRASMRIRKVSAADAKITTVAGKRTGADTGLGGFGGDGGPAVRAELSNSYAVAIDSSGKIHIADSSNNPIRKVNAVTGVITTLAGYSGMEVRVQVLH